MRGEESFAAIWAAASGRGIGRGCIMHLVNMGSRRVVLLSLLCRAPGILYSRYPASSTQWWS